VEQRPRCGLKKGRVKKKWKKTYHYSIFVRAAVRKNRIHPERAHESLIEGTSCREEGTKWQEKKT